MPTIRTSHVAWLWAAVALLSVLGVLFVAAPAAVMDRMAGVEATDRLLGMWRVGASVMLAEAVVIMLAIRSRRASDIRLVTVLVVIHFSIETAIRIAIALGGEGGSLTAALPQALIALALANELRRQPGTVRADVAG